MYPILPPDPNNFQSGASELSWGKGICPIGADDRDVPPCEGGRYFGKTPKMDFPPVTKDMFWA